MSGAKIERSVPKIIPCTQNSFAHISSKEIDRLKGKRDKPITERIFGASLDGKTIFLEPADPNEKPFLFNRVRKLRYYRMFTEDSVSSCRKKSSTSEQKPSDSKKSGK